MTEPDTPCRDRSDGTGDEAYVRELEQYRRRLDGAMFAGGLAWWEMDVETGAVEFHENKADALDASPGDFEHYEDFTELIHPEDHDRAMAAMREHLEGSAEKYDVEYRIRTASGEYRWFHDVGGVTERAEDGSPAKVTGVVVDVTNRKETEERLRRKNEQLSLLNRIIRHDIRNDMTVITGWVDVIAEEATPEQRERLGRIRRAGEHTTELTRDVGDLVEALEDESGGIELHPVSLERVVVDEVERVTRSFEDTEVTIEDGFPAVAVEANGMLSSVVGNLLNNALKHSDEETPRVEVDAEVRDDVVVLRVADDGPGIPEARREEIFHRDVKGLESEGTGLGLFLVRTLVDAYGGTVRVADNEPKGTVVTVELNRASST